MVDLARRRATLVAALGFARLSWQRRPPAATALHAWLDSWRGMGDVIGGMQRHGYDVDLMSLGPQRWQATILADNPTGGVPVVPGYAEAPTPWQAVQQAAWQALTNPSQPV